jgi:hypothetical protein
VPRKVIPQRKLYNWVGKGNGEEGMENDIPKKIKMILYFLNGE